MISYEPFWNLMKKNNATTYTLQYKIRIDNGTIKRLQNNEYVSTSTIEKICAYFKCAVQDVMEFIEEE